MARITVEDCLKRIDNQFDLVMTAAKRARRIANGADPLVDLENDKPTVVALREIAEGLINEEILAEMDEPIEDILSSEAAEELLASTPMPGMGSEAPAAPAMLVPSPAIEIPAAPAVEAAPDKEPSDDAVAAAIAAELAAAISMPTDVPTDIAAPDETPAEEASVEETAGEETSGEEQVAKAAPAEGFGIASTPSDEAPAAEAPADDDGAPASDEDKPLA